MNRWRWWIDKSRNIKNMETPFTRFINNVKKSGAETPQIAKRIRGRLTAENDIVYVAHENPARNLIFFPVSKF